MGGAAGATEVVVSLDGRGPLAGRDAGGATAVTGGRGAIGSTGATTTASGTLGDGAAVMAAVVGRTGGSLGTTGSATDFAGSSPVGGDSPWLVSHQPKPNAISKAAEKAA